jgi:hypothetical protein
MDSGCSWITATISSWLSCLHRSTDHAAGRPHPLPHRRRPYAHTETVKIAVSRIRAGAFAVSWVEASGATVVHVEDFARGVVHSYATLPDSSFLRMQGPIRLISEGEG